MNNLIQKDKAKRPLLITEPTMLFKDDTNVILDKNVRVIMWCDCRKKEKMKQLRKKFFKECVDNGKVNYAPHDLFEWFKKNI